MVSSATVMAIEAFCKVEKKRMQLQRAENELTERVRMVPSEDMPKYVEATQKIIDDNDRNISHILVQKKEEKLSDEVLKRLRSKRHGCPSD